MAARLDDVLPTAALERLPTEGVPMSPRSEEFIEQARDRLADENARTHRGTWNLFRMRGD